MTLLANNTLKPVRTLWDAPLSAVGPGFRGVAEVFYVKRPHRARPERNGQVDALRSAEAQVEKLSVQSPRSKSVLFCFFASDFQSGT